MRALIDLYLKIQLNGRELARNAVEYTFPFVSNEFKQMYSTNGRTAKVVCRQVVQKNEKRLSRPKTTSWLNIDYFGTWLAENCSKSVCTSSAYSSTKSGWNELAIIFAGFHEDSCEKIPYSSCLFILFSQHNFMLEKMVSHFHWLIHSNVQVFIWKRLNIVCKRNIHHTKHGALSKLIFSLLEICAMAKVEIS